MKATGIVRRIDDLGRVVIPKEIRRTMRIREGDPLEIFTNKDGEVIFKKYSPLGELSSISHEICETVSKVSGQTCAILDKDSVVACYGNLKGEAQDERVSKYIERIMGERSTYQHKKGEAQLAINENNKKCIVKVLSPIINDGDITGAIALISDDHELECDVSDVKLINSSALFLSKHMSN
ncbi:MAG: stage V sporulation T C-terminal domain-containing protein [Clostridia bacterium]